MKNIRYIVCVLFLLLGGCSEGDNVPEKPEKVQVFTDQRKALEQARQVEQLSAT